MVRALCEKNWALSIYNSHTDCSAAQPMIVAKTNCSAAELILGRSGIYLFVLEVYVRGSGFYTMVKYLFLLCA